MLLLLERQGRLVFAHTGTHTHAGRQAQRVIERLDYVRRDERERERETAFALRHLICTHNRSSLSLYALPTCLHVCLRFHVCARERQCVCVCVHTTLEGEREELHSRAQFVCRSISASSLDPLPLSLSLTLFLFRLFSSLESSAQI